MTLRATLSGSVQFTGPESVSITDPLSVSVPYTGMVAEVIPVPSGTEAAVVFDVPLGGLTSILGYKITNRADHDVDVKVNTVLADRLAPGGVFMRMSPVAVSASETTALSVTTKGISAVDGHVDCVVFGN